jgi:hypothetical protein
MATAIDACEIRERIIAIIYSPGGATATEGQARV